MFSGPAHTLPVVGDMFSQYMSYFVEPRDADEDASTKDTNRKERDTKNMDSCIIEVKVTVKKDVTMQDTQDVEEKLDEGDCNMNGTDWDQIRSIVHDNLDRPMQNGQKSK